LPFPGRLSVEKRRRVESDKRSVAGVWRLTPIRTNEPSAPTEEARSSRRRLGAAYEAVRQPRLRPAARQSAPKRLRSNLDPCGGAYSGKFALAARPLCSPRKVKADLYVRTSRPCHGRSQGRLRGGEVMAKSKPCQSPTAKLQPVQIHEHAPASTIKGRSRQRGRSRCRGQCTGERQVGGTHDDGKRRLSTCPPVFRETITHTKSASCSGVKRTGPNGAQLLQESRST
jgi:hypothetical protein